MLKNILLILLLINWLNQNSIIFYFFNLALLYAYPLTDMFHDGPMLLTTSKNHLYFPFNLKTIN